LAKLQQLYYNGGANLNKMGEKLLYKGDNANFHPIRSDSVYGLIYLRSYFMKSILRVLPLVALIIALGVAVIPAAGQDLMSLSAPDCEYGGNISSIEAVDATTVKFTLCNPDPAIPAKLAFSAMAIHSSDQLAAADATDLLNNPIGTGPYKLDHWDRGNELVLTSSESYWGTPALEPTLILKQSAEASARLLDLQAGTADGIFGAAPGDFAVVQGDPNLSLLPIPATNVFYIGINNTKPPFDNVNVRLAIAHGIDKQRIVDNFYPEGSTVADQFMPPSIFGYTPDAAVNAYDPELARQLLADSGVELPIEVELHFRNVVRGYLPQPPIVAADIQAQLAEIGINVTPREIESGTFIPAAHAGEYQMTMLGWGADYPDATNFLDFHFNNPTEFQFGDQDPVLVDLLTQAAQLSDPAARLELYKQANDEIAAFVPMVPIANGGSADAYLARIANAYVSGFGATQFALLEDPEDDNIVYIGGGEPASLYCNDETDGETLRACEQINESLLAYNVDGSVKPALATEWSANEDATEWTFTLRDGVTFSDGSTFDANDVVATFVAMWDASSPMHVGNAGQFAYFGSFFGTFLNAPPAEG
jgi:peptide/nickel transport system substrate-binding protein